jgi:hypothetical protein
MALDCLGKPQKQSSAQLHSNQHSSFSLREASLKYYCKKYKKPNQIPPFVLLMISQFALFHISEGKPISLLPHKDLRFLIIWAKRKHFGTKITPWWGQKKVWPTPSNTLGEMEMETDDGRGKRSVGK